MIKTGIGANNPVLQKFLMGEQDSGYQINLHGAVDGHRECQPNSQRDKFLKVGGSSNQLLREKRRSS